MPSPKRGNRFMLFLIVFGTLASFAAAIGLELAGQLTGWRMNSAAENIIFQMLSLFLPCLIYFLAVRQPVREILPLKRLSTVNVALIFFMTLCIAPLAMLLGSITSLFAGNEVSSYIVSTYNQPFALIVLSFCVSPAIFEEMALRGVVFSNYKHLGLKKAALMNGVFFGVMHLQLEQFFYAFLLGAVFACFVYYTRSLWSSVFAHFIFNFCQTAVSYISYQNGIREGLAVEDMLAAPPMSEQLSGILWLALVSVIFTFVFCILLNAFRQYNIRRIISLEMEEAEELHWQALLGRSDDEPEDTAELPPQAQNQDSKVFTWSFWALIAFYIAFISINYMLLVPSLIFS